MMSALTISSLAEICPAPVPVFLVDRLDYCPAMLNIMEPAKSVVVENLYSLILNFTAGSPSKNIEGLSLNLDTGQIPSYRERWLVLDRGTTLMKAAPIYVATIGPVMTASTTESDNAFFP
ncbi:hypothetical protein ONS95_014361 [Cadophora gregata]|uniref:uncharacterized protein n=1 Tax=Cadophora gregata TaxID=51156 RepID=UPI0026DD886A|nr:uncharacterized protein ONS95_014361 [Cadophora gregata]KAK0112618.1 hypothetical protein ONS95_014361 [Cadophora gregata]KAK0124751.1 hypothetical protein ONS96_008633 [Cadophora gregata f. sp. sojae]